VIDQLLTVSTVNQDGATVLLNVMIWADQRDEQADTQAYAKPACFLETVFSSGTPVSMGQTAYDVVFRVMIEQEQYNTEGNIDTELSMLDLPDAVHRVLNGFKPEYCSPLFQSGTQLDYTSGNTEFTVLEYSSCFIDLVGSRSDALMGYTEQTITNPQLVIEETILVGQAWDDGSEGNTYSLTGYITAGFGSGVHQWFTGSGAPSGVSGSSNGDYYRDADNGDIYYLQSGVWALVGTIVGGGGGGSGMLRIIANVVSDTNAGSTASTDYVYICNGTFSLTLPTAVSNKNRYSVINIGTGTVTVRFTSGQTCNGSATIPMSIQYQAREFTSNNSNWNVI
jgi:hypothetical protein